VARADSAGKPMSRSAAGELVALAGPVPHDIQRLAYETFDAAGRRINSDDVVAGLERIVMHEASAYSDRFSRLGIGQRRVLQALAERSPLEQPYTASSHGGSAMPGARCTPSGDRPRRRRTVESRANGLVVADPFFAWCCVAWRSGWLQWRTNCRQRDWLAPRLRPWAQGRSRREVEMSEIPEGTEGERPAGDERPRLRAIPAPRRRRRYLHRAGTHRRPRPLRRPTRTGSRNRPIPATRRVGLPGLPEWGEAYGPSVPHPRSTDRRLRATGYGPPGSGPRLG